MAYEKTADSQRLIRFVEFSHSQQLCDLRPRESSKGEQQAHTCDKPIYRQLTQAVCRNNRMTRKEAAATAPDLGYPTFPART